MRLSFLANLKQSTFVIGLFVVYISANVLSVHCENVTSNAIGDGPKSAGENGTAAAITSTAPTTFATRSGGRKSSKQLFQLKQIKLQQQQQQLQQKEPQQQPSQWTKPTRPEQGESDCLFLYNFDLPCSLLLSSSLVT